MYINTDLLCEYNYLNYLFNIVIFKYILIFFYITNSIESLADKNEKIPTIKQVLSDERKLIFEIFSKMFLQERQFYLKKKKIKVFFFLK